MAEHDIPGLTRASVARTDLRELMTTDAGAGFVAGPLAVRNAADVSGVVIASWVTEGGFEEAKDAHLITSIDGPTLVTMRLRAGEHTSRRAGSSDHSGVLIISDCPSSDIGKLFEDTEGIEPDQTTIQLWHENSGQDTRTTACLTAAPYLTNLFFSRSRRITPQRTDSSPDYLHTIHPWGAMGDEPPPPESIEPVSFGRGMSTDQSMLMPDYLRLIPIAGPDAEAVATHFANLSRSLRAAQMSVAVMLYRPETLEVEIKVINA